MMSIEKEIVALAVKLVDVTRRLTVLYTEESKLRATSIDCEARCEATRARAAEEARYAETELELIRAVAELQRRADP
jgi:hypothetical protein